MIMERDRLLECRSVNAKKRKAQIFCAGNTSTLQMPFVERKKDPTDDQAEFPKSGQHITDQDQRIGACLGFFTFSKLCIS